MKKQFRSKLKCLNNSMEIIASSLNIANKE